MMFIGILLIGAIIYFWVNPRNNIINSSKEPSALNVLKERYVRGEITEEEYLKIKKTIE